MLQSLVDLIGTQLGQLPDYRKVSPNQKYTIRDAALSAFAVFMMQSPSFLAQQRDMERTKGRDNTQSLFGVHRIPSDNQIRALLDPIAPSYVSEPYWKVFEQLKAGKLLVGHTGIASTWLCTLDGVHFFSSSKIHCQNCTRQEHDGHVHYGHSMVAPALVAPHSSNVFSLEPEFVLPQDGSEKQDCEQNATRRHAPVGLPEWLSRNAARLGAEQVTFLGDDLYCKQPFCEQVMALQSHFILICKPDSHETLYTEVELLATAKLLDTRSERVWNGRFHEQRRYRFTNGVPLRAGADGLLVNWCDVTIVHTQTAEQLYYNSFVTNYPLSQNTVAEVVRSGRARWKTENEHYNTLKNRGYHLEHNFGHGEQYLSALLASLNLLAFLLHTVLWLTEPTALQVRTALGTLQTFWGDVRTLTRLFYFRSWAHLFDFMHTQLELEASP